MIASDKGWEVSAARERFLQEMGEVVASAFSGFQVESDGVVQGAFGRWVPLEEQAPLDVLFKVMRLAGLEPRMFKFQQYSVTAANPYHAGRVDLKFPDQLVVKGPGYEGIHQVDLVLKSPFVAAAVIMSGTHAAE